MPKSSLLIPQEKVSVLKMILTPWQFLLCVLYAFQFSGPAAVNAIFKHNCLVNYVGSISILRKSILVSLICPAMSPLNPSLAPSHSGISSKASVISRCSVIGISSMWCIGKTTGFSLSRKKTNEDKAEQRNPQQKQRKHLGNNIFSWAEGNEEV